MSSDNNINISPFEILLDFFLLISRNKARNHLCFNRETVKTLANRLVMLERKNRCRHKNRTLFTVGNALKRSTQRNLCLTEADIAA